jgi:hypothetical protein
MEGLSEGRFAAWEVHFPSQCPAKDRLVVRMEKLKKSRT